MAFTPAQRRHAKLRLAISGTAGAGKTYSALLLAAHFGARIAVMDSERGSALKYAGEPGLPPFDHQNLEEKTVQEYLRTISEAAAAGYDVLVIDSYSHAWLGALDAVDKMGGSSKFSTGWKVVSPLVTKLTDAILSYPGHVIATMRSKADYAIEKDEKTGKAVPRKLGMATVARDGTDYEFDVMIDLTVDGGLSVSKTRCAALNGQIWTRDDVPRVAKVLTTWLSAGAPLSALESLTERIRGAPSLEALAAIVPEIKALSDVDRAAIRPAFDARKKALSDALTDGEFA
jgi:hypothetical protein